MPEDVKPKDQAGDPGPQPAFDPEAIRAAVRQELADWQPPQPETRESEPAREPQGTSDPLTDLIGSRVNPALARLGYAVADAKDAALYYVEHPEMVPHKRDLEEAFITLMRQGSPMSREAVGDWYRGKNYEKFKEMDARATKEAEERALAAADSGPGAARRREVVAKDPHEMSDDELSKAMQGVAF